MPNSSNRIVLVQISDPHFSKDLRNRSIAPISGYRAHDHQLAQSLPVGIDDALEQVGASRDEATLIVSGDLTVCGTPGQFARARRFLRVLLPGTHGRDAWGLGWPADRQHQIPGNHDHWDGQMPPYTGMTPPRAYNPDLFPYTGRTRSWAPPFVRHPWKLPSPLRAGALAVEIYGIDTQSGHPPTDTNWRAGGRIDPLHLQRLEAMLPKVAFDPERIRVLVMHHPLVDSPFAWKTLDAASLQTVSAFLRRHHFAVVLAGHEHTFSARPVAVVDGVSRGEVLELRCPSSLQGEPKDGVQGFLLHEIRLDASPSWTTTPWRWQWSHGNGSTPTGKFLGEDPVPSRLPTVAGERNWALEPPTS